MWILLVAVAIAVLTWLAVRLMVKGAQALQELMNFSEIASKILDESSTYQAQKFRENSEAAIFRPISESFAEYEQSKNERVQRRIQKRETLGQPQNLSDLRNTSRKGATHVR